MTLKTIKLVHTAVWAVLAFCVLALPVANFLHRTGWAAVFSALILGECLVLALNRGRCPLTPLAAHYTDDRRDNFDIYLPLWLARHNKKIFGSLLIIGLVIGAIFQ